MPHEDRHLVSSPIGRLLLTAARGRLTALAILADTAGAPDLPVATSNPVLLQAAAQLEAYFAGGRQSFELPLELTGLSPFSRVVLTTLQAVPFGTTLSYGELAARCGRPRAARAIGRVMAANPQPLIIPCHRVVAAQGGLGGYSGGCGLDTKAWLLAFEQAHRLESSGFSGKTA